MGTPPRPGALAKSLGRYEFVCEIARSYIGPLWAAKTLHGDVEGFPAAIRRLDTSAVAPEAVDGICEASFWAMEVEHPRVARVVDVVVGEGEVGIVADYAEGEPLRTLLRQAGIKRKPLGQGVSLRVVKDLLLALEAVHAAGSGLGDDEPYVFGGVGPDSVMIGTDGETRVLDIGMGPVVSALDPFARHADRAAYLAPELLTEGARPDARADVFAVGVILWELLSNRRLFMGASFDAVAQRVKTGPIPPLDKVTTPGMDAVAASVVELTARALERNPGLRFASAGEMLAAIDASGVMLGSVGDAANTVNDLASHAIGPRRRAVDKACKVVDAPLSSRRPAANPRRSRPNMVAVVDTSAPSPAASPSPPAASPSPPAASPSPPTASPRPPATSPTPPLTSSPSPALSPVAPKPPAATPSPPVAAAVDPFTTERAPPSDGDGEPGSSPAEPAAPIADEAPPPPPAPPKPDPKQTILGITPLAAPMADPRARLAAPPPKRDPKATMLGMGSDNDRTFVANEPSTLESVRDIHVSRIDPPSEPPASADAEPVSIEPISLDAITIPPADSEDAVTLRPPKPLRGGPVVGEKVGGGFQATEPGTLPSGKSAASETDAWVKALTTPVEDDDAPPVSQPGVAALRNAPVRREESSEDELASRHLIAGAVETDPSARIASPGDDARRKKIRIAAAGAFGAVALLGVLALVSGTKSEPEPDAPSEARTTPTAPPEVARTPNPAPAPTAPSATAIAETATRADAGAAVDARAAAPPSSPAAPPPAVVSPHAPFAPARPTTKPKRKKHYTPDDI